MLDETKEILKAVGMEEEVKCIDHGFCPTCKQPIVINEFKDELSKKEFEIRGLCQICQNLFFTEEMCMLFPKGRLPVKAFRIHLQ